MGGDYGLVHAFMNQSKNFVLGFEVGIFYQMCENGNLDPDGEYPFHAENKGEVLRVASRFNLRLKHCEDSEDWILLQFHEEPSP